MSISSQATAVQAFLLALQRELIAQVEQHEPTARFQIDAWQKPDTPDSPHALGGGGRTAVLKNGTVFEQAGIGFSDVHGKSLPPSASAVRPELAGRSFRAMGVSVVMHPRNPFAPTSHMNVRYFEAHKADEPTVWWFGGGFDLTPFYPFDDDIVHWHQTAKAICDAFDASAYKSYKQHCDQYFYLKHRQETRGIGGIFFDDLSQPSFETCFAFQQAVGRGYADALLPIISKRHALPYGERELDFMRYRRGRYVEFNLVWDRGTLFGLQSGGRAESILMSLPPTVRFEYGYSPTEASAEARLMDYLRPRDWLCEFAGGQALEKQETAHG